MSGIDWSEFPYKTYVTDKDGELLQDGKLRLESGEIVDEDNQAYFDSVKSSVENFVQAQQSVVPLPTNEEYYKDILFDTTPLPTDEPVQEAKFDTTPLPTDEEYYKDILFDEPVQEAKEEKPRSFDDEFGSERITTHGDTPANLAVSLTDNIDEARNEALAQRESVSLNKKLDEAIENATWFNPEYKARGYSPTTIGFNLVKDFIGGKNSLVEVLGDSIGDKTLSTSALWYNNTHLGKSFDYISYDYGFLRGGVLSSVFGEEDKAYQDRSTKHEDILKTIQDNKLPMNAYGTLADAKSREHEASLLEGLRIKQSRSEIISRSFDTYSGGLSDTNLAMAAVSLFDVETLTLGSFGTMAKLTKAPLLNASFAAAVNSSVNALVQDIDPNVSKSEAWAYSMLGLIDAPWIYKLGVRETKPLYGTLNKMPTEGFLTKMKDSVIPNEFKQIEAPKTQYKFQEPIGKLADEIIDVEVIETRLSNQRIKDMIISPMKRTSDKYKEITSSPEFKARLLELKSELKQKRLITESHGFKKLRDKVKLIHKELKNKELTDKARGKKELKYQIARQKELDYRLITTELKNNIDEFKEHMEWLGKESKLELADDILGFYKAMHKEGAITDIEMAKLIRQKNNVKYPKLRLSENKDGTFSVKSKDGKRTDIGNTIPAAVVAAIGATTALEAGDFDYRDMGIPASLLLMGAMAFFGRKKLYAGYKKAYDSILTQSNNMDNNRAFRSKIIAAGMASRTRATETITPMLNDGNKEFVDFVRKVYTDPINGGTKNIDQLKDIHYKSMWFPTNKYMNDAFNEYIALNNNVALDKISNLLDYTNGMRYTFDRQVMEAIELGSHKNSAPIQKAVKVIQELKNRFKNEIESSSMKVIHFNTDDSISWMPRYKNPSLSVVLRTISPSSYKALVQAFSKTLTKTPEDKRLATATAYMDWSKNVSTSHGHSHSSVSEIEEYLSAKGLDGVINANELADFLGIGTEVWGRTKDRIFIDKSLFPREGVTVTSREGAEMQMKMDDIFESSATQVVHKYISELSGHLAFADAGFETVGKALEYAKKANNPVNQARAEKDILLFSGKSNIDMTDPSNMFWADMRNYTIAVKMPASVLSLTQELFTTMQRVGSGAWIQAFSKEARNVLEAGDDSLMVQLILQSGRAMHRYGATYGGIKNIDEFGIREAGGGKSAAGAIFSKSGEIARDFILNQFGMVRASDFLEAVNLSDSAKVLHDIATGKLNLMDYELVTYGITPEFINFLKGLNMGVNSKGFVKKLPMDKWNREERMKFLSVVDNMMQKRIQHARFGTTPAYFRDSMLGRVASSLLSFPISAFSNIGSFLGRGMMAGDINAYMQSGLWFAGGAVSAIARWELQGKDYDAEDILWAAILSHPTMGIASLESAYSSPAPMDTLQRFTEIYGH